MMGKEEESAIWAVFFSFFVGGWGPYNRGGLSTRLYVMIRLLFKLGFIGELGLLVSLPLEGKVAAQPTDEV